MNSIQTILVYGGIGALIVLILISLIVQLRSRRKNYRCPYCGEIIHRELIDIVHCQACGGLLHLEDDSTEPAEED